MSRTVLLVVIAGLFSALLFLPRPDGVRLAATQVGSLLLEPASPGLYVAAEDESGSAEVEAAGRLWDVLRDSSAAEAGADGNWTLRVRGYRMDLSRTAWKDSRLHARMLESVGRSLRAIGAAEGVEVQLEQRTRADYEGAVLFCCMLDGELLLEVQLPDGSALHAKRPWRPAGPVSVLPSLLAIGVALIIRRPLLALALGALLGAVLERAAHGSSWLESAVQGPLHLVQHHAWAELQDPTRREILIFLVAILAMVGVVSAAGGLQGLARSLARVAGNARRSQCASFGLGLVVFFDHCANAMLVGTTMRPLTDRFRVSREKLAYLVDSTAAPVAGLSVFSTWIAFEVSAFSPQLPEAGMAASQGYGVFLQTLPYRFYSLFTLGLVALVVFSGRDFGPMLRAERRARAGQVTSPGFEDSALDEGGAAGQGGQGRASTAVVPLVVFVLTTMVAAWWRGTSMGPQGGGAGLLNTILAGSGTTALVLGASAGLAAALVLGGLRGLGLGVLPAGLQGVRTALPALALLACAWLLGAVCYELGTAAYLSVILQDSLNPLLLPILLFAVAGAIALSTGSSWGTMTILLPLVVGLAYDLGQSTPIGGTGMVVVCIASILEGAIFGDHCSPISDTTVLSSMAAGSGHLEHVRTQAPYALLAMGTAILCGYFPAVIAGLSPWWSLLLGAVVMTAVFRFYSRPVDMDEATDKEAEGDAKGELAGLDQRAA